MTKRNGHRQLTTRGSNRRSVVKGFVCAMLALPTNWVRAIGQFRSDEAFQRERLSETLTTLFGNQPINAHGGIRIIAADLAENGAVVPIKIEYEIDNVASVTILATENPFPLVGKFDYPTLGSDFVATRIKLAKSCDVIAVVETQDGLYRSQKPIEVTIGGCTV